jgi:hypothetical protein
MNRSAFTGFSTHTVVGTRRESIFLGSGNYLDFLHVMYKGSVVWNVPLSAF